MTNTQDLPAIRNQLYDRVERWWLWSLRLGLLLQLIAVASILLATDTFLAGAATVGLFVPIAVTWLRYHAAQITNNADKCRRLILYSDGLGQEIPAYELAIVRGWATGESAAAPFVAPYYASTLPAGPRRLLDITAEAAFFTHELAKKEAFRRLWVFVVSLLLVAAVVYVGIETASTDILALIARAALAAVALLVAGDLLVLCCQYFQLASSSERSFRECARLREGLSVSTEAAHQVVEDYHLTVAQSPPIPGKLYKKHVDRLNEVYRQSHAVGEDNG